MQTDVRATYAVFPRWSQPFWTWLTGKPAQDEPPPFSPNCWLYLAIALLFFVGGVAGSLAVVTRADGWRWLAIATVASTLHGERLLILTIAHQCAHFRFCGSKRLNQLVHDVLTTVVCSQNFEAYRFDHFHVHHALKTFGTYQDPVLILIRQLGFTEGVGKRQLWWRLAWTCVSPAFHGRYLFNRFRNNFLGRRTSRRLAAMAWWALLVALVALRPELRLPIAVAYLLPVLFLYNISAFLELLCEHTWMRPLGEPLPRQRAKELIWGRFCGDPVPAVPGGGAWIRWGARMALYHLPCRLFVLSGDAPQHDYHHVNPNDAGWTMSAYRRRDLVASGRLPDHEVWGLFEAIDKVFGDIEQARSAPSAVAYLGMADAAPLEG